MKITNEVKAEVILIYLEINIYQVSSNLESIRAKTSAKLNCRKTRFKQDNGLPQSLSET
jgi:hypothetical protein